jgi:hypothetical protein
MKLALPVEASNTGTVIALDTITDISNIKTERHTAIFVFNPVEGEQVRVEVSDMEEKILFSSDKYSIESGSAVIKWNAKKAKEELPGVFKYRSFVREKYMRGKTFIVR